MAARLTAALQSRLSDWGPVFDLKPPFDFPKEGDWKSAFKLPAAGETLPHYVSPGSAMNRPFLFNTAIRSGTRVRLIMTLAASWEDAAGGIGFGLIAPSTAAGSNDCFHDLGAGYRMLLIPCGTGSSNPSLPYAMRSTRPDGLAWMEICATEIRSVIAPCHQARFRRGRFVFR